MLLQKNSVVVNKNVNQGIFRKAFTHMGNCSCVNRSYFTALQL